MRVGTPLYRRLWPAAWGPAGRSHGLAQRGAGGAPARAERCPRGGGNVCRSGQKGAVTGGRD